MKEVVSVSKSESESVKAIAINQNSQTLFSKLINNALEQ